MNRDAASHRGEAASRHTAPMPPGFFSSRAGIDLISGNLPHWRQDGVVYFVTFRLADSLPQEKLRLWARERARWLAEHPEPHDETTRREFHHKFTDQMHRWLDLGHGNCVLLRPEVHRVMEVTLRHFSGQRYALDEFTVAANHVHVLLAPYPAVSLSSIVHSWKSYSAHQIRRILLGASAASQDAVTPASASAWMKEYFDHIVRSPASMEKFREYIRSHRPDLRTDKVEAAPRRFDHRENDTRSP